MNDELYMRRCLQLAELGMGRVAPNPMVGAVMVYNNRIIGEGYHEKYGEPHAEVNCINSVHPNDFKFIPEATLYVSLEPCAHFGKTPPCADFIIQHQIKRVILGTADIFSKVNGKGIDHLRKVGIEVAVGICEEDCIALNKRFFTFHQKKRPYIILKWAQTANGFIGNFYAKRLIITNEFTNRLSHKWRSEEAAIIVGTNTVLLDNPSLTNRLYSGKSPVRMFVDEHLQADKDSLLFDVAADTVIFNEVKEENASRNHFVQISFKKNVEEQILQYCYEQEIQSIIIEGGAEFLQSFIDKKLWDECRIITNTHLYIDNGISAPLLTDAAFISSENLYSDKIDYLVRR